ncbi:MAG: hypothetical protein GXY80_12415 [Syntrophorhabdus aromaticivorans]|uniref:Transcriptional regulator n=1 Tax=Syntrophorhabdus aromaticivorans TaxID=328301 RepID=A0A971S251_9BACT|nr:hypothetical protein [Syntrophorhabdus aromaticivorans]
MWINLLRTHVKVKGIRQVAVELGVSKSMISLLCNDKYPASTANIEARIRKVYGNNGLIECPILGQISAARCAETWGRAKAIGNRASNPETIRLYHRCRQCGTRK